MSSTFPLNMSFFLQARYVKAFVTLWMDLKYSLPIHMPEAVDMWETDHDLDLVSQKDHNEKNISFEDTTSSTKSSLSA